MADCRWCHVLLTVKSGYGVCLHCDTRHDVFAVNCQQCRATAETKNTPPK